MSVIDDLEKIITDEKLNPVLYIPVEPDEKDATTTNDVPPMPIQVIEHEPTNTTSTGKKEPEDIKVIDEEGHTVNLSE